MYFPWPFRLHMVRLMLLERLLQTLPQLRNVGGVRAIPYMQVSLSSPGSVPLWSDHRSACSHLSSRGSIRLCLVLGHRIMECNFELQVVALNAVDEKAEGQRIERDACSHPASY